MQNYRTLNNIVYNFSTNGLVNYNVEKSVISLDNEVISNYFNEEYIFLQNYNIPDLTSDDISLSYTIDLLSIDNYESLFPLAASSRQIEVESEANGWRCE